MTTLLALDAGNSKTDLAVLATDGTVLRRVRTDGFRPHLGEAAALEVLRSAIRSASGSEIPARAGLYLANADLPEQEHRFAAALEDHAEVLTVANDTFALLRSGSKGSTGVAVVCGAGINCVGVGLHGQVARFPALGPLTGDRGGGMDLATWSLRAACRAEDGRGPWTQLAPAIADLFGTTTAVDCGIALSTGAVATERLHEIVPVLFATARDGDKVAVQLVRDQADEVLAFARVALTRCDLLDAETDIVLGGGVLAARADPLTRMVHSGLHGLAPRATLVVPDLPPIHGAALLTLEAHLGGPAPADVEQRLRASW
ncbi:ATPase [Nakamurella sp. YIM 132087]|uniref:ATPase n=1 Tax=Nakamurella alba TaxID=2665158 RepID=A0A7K1FG03_9ACTN|nr:BadF/BadG/BcrA/BcrD ATPase family protein [Nakamurella alba]MTD13041.1 ATPase [Nakamurella alba]